MEGAGAVTAAGAVVPGIRVNHWRVPEMEMSWSADEDFGVKQEQAIVFRFCDVSHASTPG